MANHYYDVKVLFTAREATTDDNFEQFVDCVIDELGNLGIEADVVGSLASRLVHFLIRTEDWSEDAATSTMSDLRTALHAANCATPSWPTKAEILGMNIVDDDREMASA